MAYAYPAPTLLSSPRNEDPRVTAEPVNLKDLRASMRPPRRPDEAPRRSFSCARKGRRIARARQLHAFAARRPRRHQAQGAVVAIKAPVVSPHGGGVKVCMSKGETTFRRRWAGAWVGWVLRVNSIRGPW